MTWKEIHPGHIIKILKDHYFPADAVLLMTSDPQGSFRYTFKNLLTFFVKEHVILKQKI